MQLLQMDIVPKFTEWAKQGEVGKRKLQCNTLFRYHFGFYTVNWYGISNLITI